MNNVASPTVSSPTVNNLLSIGLSGTEIPKVQTVADASRYPAKPNSEDVLLDSNDPDIAYFRKTDANGFVQVDRRRCIPEPEPTQQDLNDARYLSREEFSNFMNEFAAFRKEMSDNVRVLTATATKTSNNGQSWNNKSGKHQNSDAGSNAVQQS